MNVTGTLLQLFRLSKSTKELLKERNSAQTIAAQSKDLDECRLYKSLRNTATAKMKQEKKAPCTTLAHSGKVSRLG